MGKSRKARPSVPTLVCRPQPFARRAELRLNVIEDNDPVLRHRYPPLLAEQVFGREHGLTFWTVNDDDRIALQSSSWPWQVACCWIASQTMEGAAEGIASFREWGGRIWRDRELRPKQKRRMEEAEVALNSALQDGRILAHAMGLDEAEPVPHKQWPFLKWAPDPSGEAIEFEHLLWNGARRYGPVMLSRDEILARWPPLDQPLSNEAPGHLDDRAPTPVVPGPGQSVAVEARTETEERDGQRNRERLDEANTVKQADFHKRKALALAAIHRLPLNGRNSTEKERVDAVHKVPGLEELDPRTLRRYLQKR